MTENEKQQTQKHSTDETRKDDQPAAKPDAATEGPTKGDKDTAKEAEAQSNEQDSPAAEVETPDPITLLEAEIANLKDKVLRTNAEMENLRRRTEREKQDMAKFAISNFAKDIISVDDNLNRALEAVPEGAVDSDPALKALVDGVSMTGRELANIFERNGIERIDPKGEIFDPNAHQAMFEMPNPEVPTGTILEVVATGFRIEGRILRPAMVGIAKGGKKPEKPGKEEKSAESADTTGTEKTGKQDDTTDSQSKSSGKEAEGNTGDNIDKAV